MKWNFRKTVSNYDLGTAVYDLGTTVQSCTQYFPKTDKNSCIMIQY